MFGERPEQRLDRVDHDSLRADRVDRGAEAKEEALEIPLAGILDLRARDVDVIEHEPALGLELREVEAQRRDVGGQIRSGLLEGQEHAGLVELRDAADQELHGRAASCRSPPDRRRAWGVRVAGRRP